MAKDKTAKKAKKALDGEALHIALLLDESGSMSGNTQAVIDGTNEFIGSLKGEKNADRARVTVTMFDERGEADICRTKIKAKKLSKIEPLTDGDYQPQGLTPLNDAIVKTVKTLEKEKADKAMLVIFTDGYENASETSTKDVQKLLKRKEKDGWTVLYLGANVDEQKVAASLGVPAGQTFGYTSSPEGTRNALRTTSNIGVSYLADSGVYPESDKARKIPEKTPS